VTALREWSARHGVLLVFDEVITFRAEHSGLQARYDVTPDMTALGKIIGGGFPIGAVAGRAEVMDVLNPQSPRYVFPHSGTFTANPISMTAGMAAMLKFDPPAVARLNALTDRARNGIEGAIRATGAPASVTGAGSMFLVHMKETPPRNYRDAYPTPDESRRLKALLDHLYNEGCSIISTGACTFSTPMTEAEIDTLVGAFKSGFAKLASMG
ncbi:MAG: glutamate-semialdehyde -aminomutase, partial [Pseudonocardiales bacterium]|nr:glutamate-semialdehyde -aminomutase [Pseudonocardiales bacterium]